MEIISSLRWHINRKDYANGVCSANRNMEMGRVWNQTKRYGVDKKSERCIFFELLGGFFSISNKIFMIKYDINGKPNNSSVWKCDIYNDFSKGRLQGDEWEGASKVTHFETLWFQGTIHAFSIEFLSFMAKLIQVALHPLHNGIQIPTPNQSVLKWVTFEAPPHSSPCSRPLQKSL